MASFSTHITVTHATGTAGHQHLLVSEKSQ
jgi:hypothetical protein